MWHQFQIPAIQMYRIERFQISRVHNVNRQEQIESASLIWHLIQITINILASTDLWIVFVILSNIGIRQPFSLTPSQFVIKFAVIWWTTKFLYVNRSNAWRQNKKMRQKFDCQSQRVEWRREYQYSPHTLNESPAGICGQPLHISCYNNNIHQNCIHELVRYNFPA